MAVSSEGIRQRIKMESTEVKLNGDLDESSEHEEDSDIQTLLPGPALHDESSWQIGLQVFFPYMIAGFGMVAAGLVLDVVQVLWH
jgi:solute carrier family 41